MRDRGRRPRGADLYQWAMVGHLGSAGDSIVQHFTPRNSGAAAAARLCATAARLARRFVNEDNGFTQDERVVYDDGYNAATQRFRGMQFPA